jgi:hypothetical protein
MTKLITTFKNNEERNIRLNILKIIFNTSCINELKTSVDKKIVSNSNASPRTNYQVDGIIVVK